MIRDGKIPKRSRASSIRTANVYSTEKANRIAEMIVEGELLLKDICRKEGISLTTYYKWLKEYPEFKEIVEEAKTNFHSMISDAAVPLLYKQMAGYDHKTNKKKYMYINPSPKQKEMGMKREKLLIEQTDEVKHIKPDTQAIIFALTATQPEKWKNRTTSEVTGANGSALIPDAPMSREAYAELLNALKNGLPIKAQGDDTED